MTLADVRAASAAHIDRFLPRVVVDLVGYALVSAVALACDCGMLYVLVGHGLHYIVASTLSFSAGMIVAYALSVRFVFADRRAASREAELIGFATVGIAGLVLTQILLGGFVALLGLRIALAKAMTVGIVFLFNFFGRRHLVFGAR